MPWKYTDSEKSAVTDGTTTIPLRQPTGTSRKMDMLIANGMEVAEFTPIPESKPEYSLTEIVALLISKGTIPPKG